MLQNDVSAPTYTLRGVITKIAFLGAESDAAGSLPGGYGVIESRDGDRYFFSANACGHFVDLRAGDLVAFDVQHGPLHQAINVTRDPNAASAAAQSSRDAPCERSTK